MNMTNDTNQVLAAAFQRPFHATTRRGGGNSYRSGNVTITREVMADLLKARLMTSHFADTAVEGVPFAEYVLTDKGKEQALAFIRSRKET